MTLENKLDDLLARTGQALDNPVLSTEGRVTLIDALLAGAVLLGLALNSGLGWWWADPLAALVMVPIIGKEGFDGLKGKACCDSHH